MKGEAEKKDRGSNGKRERSVFTREQKDSKYEEAVVQITMLGEDSSRHKQRRKEIT